VERGHCDSGSAAGTEVAYIVRDGARPHHYDVEDFHKAAVLAQTRLAHVQSDDDSEAEENFKTARSAAQQAVGVRSQKVRAISASQLQEMIAGNADGAAVDGRQLRDKDAGSDGESSDGGTTLGRSLLQEGLQLFTVAPSGPATAKAASRPRGSSSSAASSSAKAAAPSGTRAKTQCRVVVPAKEDSPPDKLGGVRGRGRPPAWLLDLTSKRELALDDTESLRKDFKGFDLLVEGNFEGREGTKVLRAALQAKLTLASDLSQRCARVCKNYQKLPPGYDTEFDGVKSFAEQAARTLEAVQRVAKAILGYR
jgi:hypothetical protein